MKGPCITKPAGSRAESWSPECWINAPYCSVEITTAIFIKIMNCVQNVLPFTNYCNVHYFNGSKRATEAQRCEAKCPRSHPVSGNARARAQECCLLVLGSTHPLRVTGIIYLFFMQAILAYTVTHAAFLKVSIYPSTAFCPQTFPVVFRS